MFYDVAVVNSVFQCFSKITSRRAKDIIELFRLLRCKGLQLLSRCDSVFEREVILGRRTNSRELGEIVLVFQLMRTQPLVRLFKGLLGS